VEDEAADDAETRGVESEDCRLGLTGLAQLDEEDEEVKSVSVIVAEE